MPALPHPAFLEVLTRPIWFASLLLALAAALSTLFADRGMPGSDEGALLTAAVKLLHGGVFYRDVDAYAFPGVSYLLALAMAIFGEHLSVARTVAASFYCLTVLGVYACALALMDRPRAALCGLSLLGLKFFAFPIYTIFFYADASVATAILALALFLRHRFEGASQRLFWVGTLAGLSIVTKQSTGILVAIVIGIVLCFPAFAHGPRRRRGRLVEASTYAAGVLLILGSMSLYFAIHGLFGEMLRAGLVRPFTGYLPTSGVSFLPPLAWWNFGSLGRHGPLYFPQIYFELGLHSAQADPSLRALYYGIGEFTSRLLYSAIPIAFGAGAAMWLRAFRVPDRGLDHSDESNEADATKEAELARGRFFTSAGVCLAIAVSAFPRSDFIHVITIYPAVTLLLFALCRPSLLGMGWRTGSDRVARTQLGRGLLEGACVAGLLIWTATLSIAYDGILTTRVELDRAEVWVKPQEAFLEPLIDYVDAQVPFGEPLFVYGHEAQWYFLTNRYTPRAFSQIYPGMTGDETGEQLAGLIEMTRPRVILQGVLRWPGIPDLVPYTRALGPTFERLYTPDSNAFPNPPKIQMLRVWRLRD